MSITTEANDVTFTLYIFKLGIRRMKADISKHFAYLIDKFMQTVFWICHLLRLETRIYRWQSSVSYRLLQPTKAWSRMSSVTLLQRVWSSLHPLWTWILHREHSLLFLNGAKCLQVCNMTSAVWRWHKIALVNISNIFTLNLVVKEVGYDFHSVDKLFASVSRLARTQQRDRKT